MPIHGVSTRESLDPRFKSLGKLRKGGPKRNGQFGADLDHFRFTSEDAAVVQAFYQAYGEKPSELVVFMPYDQMERNFSSWRELYGQNGLVKIRCDGENWVDWLDGPRHCHGYLPCPETFLDPDNRCPDCPLKPVGRLEVIVPELWKAGYIGLVTVETHSWNDIAHLAGKLAQYEPLRGKPFTLWREMTTIGAPNEKTGKRMAVTKHLVCIELTNERLVEELEAAQRRSLAQVQALALPAGEPLPEPAGPEWFEVEEDPSLPSAEPENGTDPEPEPGPPADTTPQTWPDKTDSEGVSLRVRFWAWADKQALTREQVYTALGVEHIHDFPGTLGDAKMAVVRWVKAQADKVPSGRDKVPA